MSKSMEETLPAVDRAFFERCGLQITDFVVEPESEEYTACQFRFGSRNIAYRKAKITPTKAGQFVTFWKRSSAGPIVPYDALDQVDVLVVAVATSQHSGQFVFSKDVLQNRGILKNDGSKGKLGFRVYPPWDEPGSGQGRKTQRWQLRYFLDISPDVSTDESRIFTLFVSE